MKDKYLVAEIEPSLITEDEQVQRAYDPYHHKRYTIIDKETGEIIDDAQGYGYRSIQKAWKALYYKLNIDKIKKDKEIYEGWWKEHKDFAILCCNYFFYEVKEGNKLTPKKEKEIIIELAKEKNIELPEDIKKLAKYL